MKEPVKGLSGWLSPKGQFYPCGHMTHSHVAMQIIEESFERRQDRIRLGIDEGTVLSHDTALRMMDWIVMGCNPYRESDSDYIFFPSHDLEWCCTEDQQLFLLAHREEMRPNQLRMYEQQIEGYDKEEKNDA